MNEKWNVKRAADRDGWDVWSPEGLCFPFMLFSSAIWSAHEMARGNMTYRSI